MVLRGIVNRNFLYICLTNNPKRKNYGKNKKCRYGCTLSN